MDGPFRAFTWRADILCIYAMRFMYMMEPSGFVEPRIEFLDVFYRAP